MSEKKSKITTKDLVQTSLLIALVFVATKFINIRLPISINGGLIHLGNTMLFTAAIVFGRKKGAIAGGIGMLIFDIVSGWVLWAPFTLVIRGAMGYVVGYFAWKNGKEGKSIVQNVTGIAISAIIMIGGYYLTEVILYGNLLAPITSIPGNLTQIGIGLVTAVPLSKALKAKRLKLGYN